MRAFIGLFAFAALASGQTGNWCKWGSLRVPPSGQARAVMMTATHRLAVYYAIPRDLSFNQGVYDRLVRATRNIQAWYQCASGGITWEFAFPEVVRVYNADQPRSYYNEPDRMNWWNGMLSEMGSKGEPVWTPGTVVGVWAYGAGWWAGGAQSCGGECGAALVGIDAFPEFNNPDWSGGACDGENWWRCTAEGGFAHELGHTLGLPHPYDSPATQGVAYHSIMQTPWSYPNLAPATESPWGFLTTERQQIRPNPFLRAYVELVQVYPGCDIVNLPVAGAPPVAGFRLDPSGLSVLALSTSSDQYLHYWMFGDGAVSNAVTAAHTYPRAGTYPVSLRVSAENGMMDLAAQQLTVTQADTTPPEISPLYNGMFSRSGWWKGQVTVSWKVTDPESGIASSDGCGPTTLTEETPGTALTCSATNGAGLRNSVTVTMRIDKHPPTVSGMPAPGACVLWPPDGRYVQVATLTASDTMSGLWNFLVSGQSNEPADPNNPDILITNSGPDKRIVQLRAERLGIGTGRVYMIKATALDVAGLASGVTMTCTVPHDQGRQ